MRGLIGFLRLRVGCGKLLVGLAASKAYGEDPLGHSKREDQGETGRWRCFTREEILKRGDNLDITWLKDESAGHGEDVGDPEIAAQILALLRTATADIQARVERLAASGRATLACPPDGRNAPTAVRPEASALVAAAQYIARPARRFEPARPPKSRAGAPPRCTAETRPSVTRCTGPSVMLCGKTKSGKFLLHRRTTKKRMRARFEAIREALHRRRHLPVFVQGQWLGQVVRGYLAYHAVPTNIKRLERFRTQVIRSWHAALRRRSQRSRTDWVRMGRLALRWIPPARVLHPYPWVRFDDRTQGRSRVR